MRVVHLLRKYNPEEWAGTETAVKRLFDGLAHYRVEPIVYCPKIPESSERDPFQEAGFLVKRFKACVPVWGLSAKQKEALIAIGGNLLSFDALWSLLKEKNVSLIHAHTHNRLGGIALTAARIKKIPIVVTLHGGVLDLPTTLRDHLAEPLKGGFEWGKVFGLPLRSRRVLQDADAIVTCNQTEAARLKERYPKQTVITQPHGVPVHEYEKDCRVIAREAFPQIIGKQMLLLVGRIDTVKNQKWLVEQCSEVFNKYPDTILVLVGPCTDAAYQKLVEDEIERRGMRNRVLMTGCLPHGDSRLIGLFQEAKVLILPSVAEPFGLVILEAWAAGTPVISSRTSGALELMRPGENGWLFDLENPAEFHSALGAALDDPERTTRMGKAGNKLVKTQYDTTLLAGRIKNLYEELIEEKRR